MRRNQIPDAVRLAAVGAFVCVGLLPFPSAADEGMWTFDHFPSATVKQKYGVDIDKAWLEHVRRAAVRIAGGCSASLVSPDGLVMTNHHCVHSCIEQLSSAKRDYVKSGFLAKVRDDELRCPAMEVNQLVDIKDVTAEVQNATKGVPDVRFFDVQKAKMSELEKACAGDSDDVRCEVVSLYRGGRFDLYRYQRYQDVRLVFAPEFQIAFFGGDLDNFTFPRYNLDVSFLRVYGKDGKPAPTPDFLRWARENAKAGDLAFVAGNPGSTSRLFTVAQLEFERDVELPTAIARLAEIRGFLAEYQRRGAEQRRTANAHLFFVENSLKALKGRLQALADSVFFDSKIVAEKTFRDELNADRVLKRQYAAAWDGIHAAVAKRKEQKQAFDALERGFRLSDLFGIARTLVRAAEELPKPNGERLAEFTDARLPQLKQKLLSKAPLYDELETALLGFCLGKVREDLGPDHPAVKALLGDRTPDEVAARAVRTTSLKDVKAREKLLLQGKATIQASKDPLIQLARSIEPAARAARQRMENEVDGPLKKNGELLAKASFAIYGDTMYPDATFTLRLSFGTIQGWVRDGKPIEPFTSFAGAYQRATGREPFVLPKSWLDAKTKIDLRTPFDMVTDNDIIGGNSGSPVVNKSGEVIGLVFDGNLESLGGEYGFDARVNRAVSVHGAALLEALDKVYDAKGIVEEIQSPAVQAKGAR
jgi:hypothetical protein